MNSRQQLRATVRRRRRALDEADVAALSRQIARRVFSLSAFRRARSVAVYLAVAGEVDCGPIIRRAWQRNLRVFAPILAKNRLIFAPLERDSRLIPNRYGIAEPATARALQRRPTELDIVIVPLVAFDSNLNRLGMGAGFYDRSFAFRKHRTKWRHPLLVGVAYSFQQVGELSAAAWDVPLDAVITEKKTFGSC